jgi:hypothetical protein
MATTASSGAEPQPQIDKGVLPARYRAERDKRLRADGNAQYLPLKGRFAQDRTRRPRNAKPRLTM